MPLFLVVLLSVSALGGLGAWLLLRWKPSWLPRKTVMIAALPLPAVIWALCLFVFFDAAIASREECGVDACAMATFFSMIGFLYGLAGYVSGLAGAFGLTAIARKRSTAEGAETVE